MKNLETEYVLSTSTSENARLKRQHELWLADTLALWKKARFERHHEILEIGSGPGYTTLDLARYLGQNCHLSAIELSPNYAEECAKRVREYPNVSILTGDILEIDLGQKQFDAIFGRWIWMWLPDPEKTLKKLLTHLKPGGMIVLQEYVDYDSMNLSSHHPIQQIVLNAITKSFRDAGGEPDIVKKLIPLFEQNHLHLELLESVGKLIRPADPFWDWPNQFYETYLPSLLEKNYLSTDEVKEFKKVWEKAHETPGTFWISPTVANVIARKSAAS